jgi:transketolase
MELRERMKEKAEWVWRKTLELHRLAPETRLASSLSDVEIFVVLYYGGLLRFDPKNPFWEDRDRVIISKGHGSISLYPILADLGYFDAGELERISREDSFLGVIPDTIIPGYETINGSLGHGLGVACGIALALKRKKIDRRVFVLCGDGEMNSGAVWEGVMFAAFHKLDNILMIVDDNRLSMLGYQKDILGLAPLEDKLAAFGWHVESVDGHDIEALHATVGRCLEKPGGCPSVIVAHTIKGRGVPQLENDSLCHIRSLTAADVDRLLGDGA